MTVVDWVMEPDVAFTVICVVTGCGDEATGLVAACGLLEQPVMPTPTMATVARSRRAFMERRRRRVSPSNPSGARKARV